MFCTFFKKIGLSIALLFSSIGNFFHKPKAIKPKPTITHEQMAKSEFVIHKDVDMVSTPTPVQPVVMIKELTTKEKIKEQEAILKQLRKQRKAEKAAKKEAAYKQWKAEQKEVMNEIDRQLAKAPKKIEVYGEWTLNEKQINTLLSDPKNFNVKSFDEPNDLFTDVPDDILV